MALSQDDVHLRERSTLRFIKRRVKEVSEGYPSGRYGKIPRNHGYAGHTGPWPHCPALIFRCYSLISGSVPVLVSGGLQFLIRAIEMSTFNMGS